MLKKIITSLFICLCGLTLNAENIDIKEGWNLFGAPSSIELNKFDNSCVDYILKYNVETDTKLGWQHHIANGEFYNYEGTEISSINEGDGFWVKANSNCIIEINDISTVPMGSPYIISKVFTISENTRDVGYIVSTSEDVTYKIVGGNDHNFFDLNKTSGALEFNHLKDFEIAENFKGDNTYSIEVAVSSTSDSTLTTRQIIEVNVTNVDEEFGFFNPQYNNMKKYIDTHVLYTPIFKNAIGEVSWDASVTYMTGGTGETIALSSSWPLRYEGDGFNFVPSDYSNGEYLYRIDINATDSVGNKANLSFPVYGYSNENSDVEAYPLAFSSDIEYEKATKLDLKAEAKLGDIEYENVNFTFEIVDFPSYGTIQNYSDGTWWYKPNKGYTGYDTFSYIASAGRGVNYPYEYVKQAPKQTVTLNIKPKAQ